MDTVIQHISDNVTAYVVISACVLPVLIYFRKQTGPVLYHGVEFLIYCVVVHVALHGMVAFASWFRTETNMERGTAVAPMTTPFEGFWKRELYNPTGLYYLEIVLAILLVVIVVYYRPMRFGKNAYAGKEPSKGPPGRGKPRYARNRGGGRGQYSRQHAKRR